MREKIKARPGVAAPGRAEGNKAHCRAAVDPVTQSTTAAPGGQRSIAELLAVGERTHKPTTVPANGT